MRFLFHIAAALAVLIGSGSSPSRASSGGLAVFRLDPLGVQPEIVARLEGLLRMELNRLADAAMPSPRDIAKVVAAKPSLKNCTGEVACLVQAGKALRVERIISGNVGGLAGSYVLNLKMVEVPKAEESRRIQESISGQPDQLIEAVRVAAYRLVAPERLRGTLEVLANVPGAAVVLDGQPLGKTPLPAQHGLSVGEHTLRVNKLGYTDVVQQIKVRLQKTARVVVTLQAPPVQQKKRKTKKVVPWYTRWWFWTAVGVAAVGVGAALGYVISDKPTINCSADPSACGL